MDNPTAAKMIINSLDLTSLDYNDTPQSITALCQKAETKYGKVAAVCVYPEFISTALREVPQGVKIATVVNFPKGDADIKIVEKEIKKAIKSGADEIDAVLPYSKLLDGDEEYCKYYLQVCRSLCG